MFGKFFKYFFLNREGRDTWDQMREAKRRLKEAKRISAEAKPGIPIMNSPFTAKPGESGLIFPDSNPEEQISLIEMAIGEAKKIDPEPMRQLPPPEKSTSPDPRLKKKTLVSNNLGPIEKSMVDVEVGDGPPKEKRLSQKHSNKKIEAIYEAMKVYHAKQTSLADLDSEARKKLQIMADVMMGNKS